MAYVAKELTSCGYTFLLARMHDDRGSAGTEKEKHIYNKYAYVRLLLRRSMTSMECQIELIRLVHPLVTDCLRMTMMTMMTTTTWTRRVLAFKLIEA